MSAIQEDNKKADGYKSRWDKIQRVWKNNQLLYGVVGFLLGLVFFPIIQALSNDLINFLDNLSAEVIGIVFTVVFIDRIYQYREDQRHKSTLLRELGDTANVTVRKAWRELKDMKLHTDGTLQGISLVNANLSNINMSTADFKKTALNDADLSYSHLVETDFSKAEMIRAKLDNTNLKRSKFKKAIMSKVKIRNAIGIGVDFISARLKYANFNDSQFTKCNFKDARLREASIQNAQFIECNMQNTNLYKANLSGTQFINVTFDQNTTLPDGRRWNPNIQLEDYTR